MLEVIEKLDVARRPMVAPESDQRAGTVAVVGFPVAVEFASITFLLQQGAFVMQVNLVVLALSIALSWVSAHHFGLARAAVGSVLAVYLDGMVTLRRIALRTGIPFRRLQDWRVLGLTILSAALAAALAWGIAGRYFAASGPLDRLIVGGALLAAAYGAMHVWCGMGRGWLAAARNPEHGT